MATLFYHPAIVHDHDGIGARGLIQAVRYYQGGPTLHHGLCGVI